MTEKKTLAERERELLDNIGLRYEEGGSLHGLEIVLYEDGFFAFRGTMKHLKAIKNAFLDAMMNVASCANDIPNEEGKEGLRVNIVDLIKASKSIELILKESEEKENVHCRA